VPEGDTVWRAALHLDRALSGCTLLETDFRVPCHATLDLSGRQVESTVARGKHLLTRIGAVCGEHRDSTSSPGGPVQPGTPDDPDARFTLHTHLRMEGSWHLYKTGSRWRRPAHEARVVLRTERWTAVGFALGVTEVVPRAAEESVVAHLGPDLLGPDWDEREALRRLQADPARPVGEAIIDQRCLAGVGNLYKAEVLFLSGVSPFLAIRDVPDLRKVVRLARRLLTANRMTPAQATTGVPRRGQEHYVYGRAGKPCRRCGTPVRSRMQGPPLTERITYWCPACQP
jgi:endonuclease VIII